MISIAAPIIGKEETEAVNKVLGSGMLAQGSRVSLLEESFAKYCGTKHALAVSSGTAAIHAALFAAGVRDGDEVITTPFSFIATVNPILMLGAKPIFVDIDPETYNINPKLIASAINKNTKAIVPVHLYGQICDWQEIKDICDRHKIKIIEDACQAVGAKYLSKKAGSLGDLGCFSLYATKNIMSGEGGIVTTNDDNYAQIIKQFRQHGMSGPYRYEHIGYNYRMTDLQAAIAIEQLKKVDRFNSKRNKNADYFNKNLSNIKGLVLPEVIHGRTHVFHQYTVRITKDFPISRDDFVKYLHENDIGAGVYYPKSLHQIEHIAELSKYKRGDFPESEKATMEVVSLPIHPNVTKKNLEKIVSTIKAVYDAKK